MGPITVEDGKYTFQTAEDGYSVDVLRHGEKWLTLDRGCNAVHALLYRIEELEATIVRLTVSQTPKGD